MKHTAVVAADHMTRHRNSGVVSQEARSVVYDLLDLPVPLRRQAIRDLPPRDLSYVLGETQKVTGSMYGLWVDTPSGFVEDVLGETIWSRQRDVLDAIPFHKRTAVPAGFGVGKCVYSGDVIPLADGRMVPAGELVGQDFEVMSWSEDGTQTRRRARAEWNAVETVHRLTTKSGRTAVRNGHHPFWKATAVTYKKNGRDLFDPAKGGTRVRVPEVDGWTNLADLKPGDLVLVPEKHHAEGTIRVADHLPKLLGYLLGDGGTSHKSQVSFTQKPGPALDEFADLIGVLGCEMAPLNREHHYRVRHSKVGSLVLADNPNSATGKSRYSPMVALVNEWGLRGKTAPHKRFPAWAWTLPNDQLADVLGRLLACDGWVYAGGVSEAGNRNGAHVGIALASEGMIRDVEAAMLRLGIIGSVRARTSRLNGKTFQSWEWSCRDRKSLLAMAETLTIPGKDEKLAGVLRADRKARDWSWHWRNAPAGYRWDEVKTVDTLPEPEQTVAIEVDGEHTFVTSFVEHNTWLAGRAVVWFCNVYPPGTALSVTTATRFRQVRNQLWPHIRKVVARAGLPGTADTVQYKIPDINGVDTLVAYGFTAPENDEAAMQGIHATRLLLVVDEAGGIAKTIGEGTNNLLTGDARMLAIGNPAMDDPGSWFEGLCEEGWAARQPGTVTIPIAAVDSPAITGELTPVCRDCDPNPDGHRIADVHLPDQDWVDRTVAAYGEDHPYVQAKVYAKFPKDSGVRVIPASWVEAAAAMAEPDGDGYVRLCDLGLPGEKATHAVARGAWVRLGVDVAADGGDEFSISRIVGDMLEERHASSGAANANSVDVAERILVEIQAAEALAGALGSKDKKVHVKVDTIGVGWGVVGLLQKWGRSGEWGDPKHTALIVPVNVSESPANTDEGAAMRPYRKRDEMWLAGRALMQPDRMTGLTRIRLRVGEKAKAQLAIPSFSANAGGLVVIESKKSMKARGRSSPDRAESILLAVYEPGATIRKNRGILN